MAKKGKKGVMKVLDTVAMVLSAAGGITWGLIGFVKINPVQMLLGSIPMAETVTYCAVGVATVYLVIKSFMK